MFHSVQISQAEGILLEQYITLLSEQGKNYEKWLCENIQSGNYQETSATLELWAGAIKQIAQHAEDSNIGPSSPNLRRASSNRPWMRATAAKKYLYLAGQIRLRL